MSQADPTSTPVRSARPRPTVSALIEATTVVSALLFVLDLFLPWTRQCLAFPFLRRTFCNEVTGWKGLGGLAGLFVVALVLIWGLSSLERVRQIDERGERRRMIQALIGLTVLALTLAEVVMDRRVLAYGAWTGVILALVLASMAFVRLVAERPDRFVSTDDRRPPT